MKKSLLERAMTYKKFDRQFQILQKNNSKIQILKLLKNQKILKKNYQHLNLSLSWTCQRDRVSLIVKFGLNKNNFVKKNDEFEFKLDLSERQSFTKQT